MNGITNPARRLTKRIARPRASRPLRAATRSTASFRIVLNGGVFFFFWPSEVPRRPSFRESREETPPPRRPILAIASGFLSRQDVQPVTKLNGQQGRPLPHSGDMARSAARV